MAELEHEIAQHASEPLTDISILLQKPFCRAADLSFGSRRPRQPLQLGFDGRDLLSEGL